MTDRTPSQVNESLDNAWALIRELQDAQRAIARTSDDLCLRVSQNHDVLKRAQDEDAARISALEIGTGIDTGFSGRPQSLQERMSRCEYSSGSRLGEHLVRIEKLETKFEQIDTVLDHDTDSMLLLNLCKRVADLELAAARRVNGALSELDKRERATIEPAVEVIIRDQTTSIDEIKRACLMLGATRVVVDVGGIGAPLLRYLQADGLPAVAMAKPEKAWWKS